MTKRAAGACFILVVLAAAPLLGVFQPEVGDVRLAGPSLLWWYLGLLAPVLAALVAIAALPDRGAGRAEPRGRPSGGGEDRAAPAPPRPPRRRGGARARSRR